MTDTVRSSDGHLLSAEEHTVLDTFHVSVCGTASLAQRLDLD